jgi:hypothetical protein
VHCYASRMRWGIALLACVACGGNRTDDDGGPDGTIGDATSPLAACDAMVGGWDVPGWICGICPTDIKRPGPQCVNGSLACAMGIPTYCACGLLGLRPLCCDPCADAGPRYWECEGTSHKWTCPAGTVSCNSALVCGDAGDGG